MASSDLLVVVVLLALNAIMTSVRASVFLYPPPHHFPPIFKFLPDHGRAVQPDPGTAL